jgi:pyruvate,water dikinase
VSSFVVGFREVDRTQVTLVGGKGAQLTDLARIDTIRVPDGFCVTTEAFRRVMADAPAHAPLWRF